MRGVDLNEYIICLKSKEYISIQRLHFCEEFVYELSGCGFESSCNYILVCDMLVIVIG